MSKLEELGQKLDGVLDQIKSLEGALTFEDATTIVREISDWYVGERQVFHGSKSYNGINLSAELATNYLELNAAGDAVESHPANVTWPSLMFRTSFSEYTGNSIFSLYTEIRIKFSNKIPIEERI